MNIPDEAVEAAAKAFYGPAYIDVTYADAEYATEQVRAMLEAAAPHIAALAWDEGLEWAAAGDWIPPVEYTANPYRAKEAN